MIGVDELDEPAGSRHAQELGGGGRALAVVDGVIAIYFTLTGLHGLHILGGMVVMAYFLGPGAKLSTVPISVWFG